MRSLASVLPTLPGLAGGKTYAPQPVWRDSARVEVRFAPLSKKEAARIWHKARRFDRQTHVRGKHGGVIGRTGLAVLYALLFDFLNYKTGRLDPSYDAIAAKAGVCRRTAVKIVRRLKELGIVHWQRRCREEKDEDGRFRLAQETNAYAVLPPSQWCGFREPPEAPPPHPSTWGATAPLPDPITDAVTELQHGQHGATLAALEVDPRDELALALAELGRAIFGPQA